MGPALYSAVLEVNSRGQYFAEWQPPNFTEGNTIALLILVGVVVLRLARKTLGDPWTELLLLMLAGGWALYTDRTVMVAAMMLVPFAAAAHPGGTARAAAACRAWRGRRSFAGAVGCLSVLALLVPRTADQPPVPDLPRLVVHPRRPAGRHRRAERLG